jgi:hypothetical protein
MHSPRAVKLAATSTNFAANFICSLLLPRTGIGHRTTDFTFDRLTYATLTLGALEQGNLFCVCGRGVIILVGGSFLLIS